MRCFQLHSWLRSTVLVALCGAGVANVGCVGDGVTAIELEDAWDGKADRNGRRTGQTLELDVDLKVGGDFLDEPSDKDVRTGWKEDEDSGGYRLKKTFSVRTDKWQLATWNDGYQLELREDGTFSLYYEIGDGDQIVRVTTSLHKKDRKFIVLESPYVLTASAGDYASGAWGTEATVKMTVKP